MKAKLAAFDTVAEAPVAAAPQAKNGGKTVSRNQRRQNAAAEGRRLASQLVVQLDRNTALALLEFLDMDVANSVHELKRALARGLGIDDNDTTYGDEKSSKPDVDPVGASDPGPMPDFLRRAPKVATPYAPPFSARTARASPPNPPRRAVTSAADIEPDDCDGELVWQSAR
jgi:hypothetical protein